MITSISHHERLVITLLLPLCPGLSALLLLRLGRVFKKRAGIAGYGRPNPDWGCFGQTGAISNPPKRDLECK